MKKLLHPAFPGQFFINRFLHMKPFGKNKFSVIPPPPRLFDQKCHVLVQILFGIAYLQKNQTI